VDQAARLRRREEARRRLYRQRRLTALGGLVGLVAVVVALVASIGGGPRSTPSATGEAEAPAQPPELPRGGRTIYPRYRVVAYYGAPQDAELGALGIGTPDQAARRLERQARGYGRGRKVMPALELIAVVAAGSSHDGTYRTRQSNATVERYLAAARRHHALLLLDVQPGRADFLTEVQRLQPYLEQPDVGLALDPEWHVGPAEVPGKVIGSMDAAEVNAIANWLAGIVRARKLPEKLLVVHQFTEDMVRNKAILRQPPGVALTLNADGFGTPANKIAKYDLLAHQPPPAHRGFKLFYREDSGLMGPRDVLRLRPRPELVVYE